MSDDITATRYHSKKQRMKFIAHEALTTSPFADIHRHPNTTTHSSHSRPPILRSFDDRNDDSQ